MFRFIKAKEKFNTLNKAVSVPDFRKRFFQCDKTTGRIKISACGFYELYINSLRIIKGFSAPYITNSDDNVYFDEYKFVIDKC